MRLVDQVADGELSGAAMKDRLAQLERRRLVERLAWPAPTG